MISTIASVYNILTATKQYVIPEYQRNYSWGEAQWKRLWNDLIAFIPKTKSLPAEEYFFGSIVRCPKNSFVPVSECWLIDGQQRTTTMIILLVALRDSVTYPIAGLDACISNASGAGALSQKLLPKKNDRPEFNSLINKKTITTNGKIKQAYDFFIGKIKSLPNAIAPTDIFSAFGHLKMVDIEIQNEDPQVIFETLNSTGRDLSPTDKIRNFVMMGLTQTDREKLLEDFWDKLDVEFAGIQDYENKIDEFIWRYLIFKLRRKVKWEEMYEEFRQYVFSQKDKGKTIFDICDDILLNASYYVQFLAPQKCNTDEKEFFEDLLALGQSTQYTFLLLLNEYNVSMADKCSILQLIVSYFVRRMFCSISNQGTNNLFIKLLSKIRKGSELTDFKNYFKNEATWQQRFPADYEFEAGWPTFELYRSNALYVLRKLEEKNSGYAITASGNQHITIEHIRPQTPTPPAWANSAIDDAEIHHIGNLTLTANNSELGNKSFADKKTLPKTMANNGIVIVGYDASPYTYLMRDVLSESKWTKTEMDARAKKLWLGVSNTATGGIIGILPKDIWPSI